MGLFSKILGNGGKKAENAAMDFLNSMAKKLNDAVEPKQPAAKPAAAAPSSAAPEMIRSDEPYGEFMPKEENQFSFNGTYQAYFEQIFRSEFADCSFELTHPVYYDSDIYTFFRDGKKVLVIELMRKRCEAQKLRRDTLRSGIPYLRFYIDCSEIGWWNARSYVVGKIRGAIG